MGYGLVDAYAAVRAACATTSSVVNFTNKTVTTNMTVINCGDINVQNVNVQNINVQSGAKLTLDATGTTTITSDFEVELGAELEIK